jgi:hypothetical protein
LTQPNDSWVYEGIPSLAQKSFDTIHGYRYGEANLDAHIASNPKNIFFISGDNVFERVIERFLKKEQT